MSKKENETKYTLLPKRRIKFNEFKNIRPRRLYQIQAVRDIPRYGVKAGDLGGYVQKRTQLSQSGDSWISKNSFVLSDPYFHTYIDRNAFIGSNYIIHGSTITDNVIISGAQGVIVKSKIHNNVKIEGNVNIYTSILKGFSSIKHNEQVSVSPFAEKFSPKVSNNTWITLEKVDFENASITGIGRIGGVHSETSFEANGFFDLCDFLNTEGKRATITKPFKSSGNAIIHNTMIDSPIVVKGDSIIKDSYLQTDEFYMDGGNLSHANFRGTAYLLGEVTIKDSFFNGENHFKDKVVILSSQFKGKNILSGDTTVEDRSFIENQVITGGIANPKNNRPTEIEEMPVASVASSVPVQISSPSASSFGTEDTYREIIRTVEADYEEYTSDIVKLIKYPAMTDAAIAETSELMIKLRAAKRVLKVNDVASLEKTARELEEAFVKAENKAYKIAATFLDDKEKASLKRAGKALAIALDGNANENERRAGYKSGMKSLEGVIPVSDKAVIALKEKIGLKEIEA